MSKEKDPYVGLNTHIRRLAGQQILPVMAVGKILSLEPLKVRANGLDLTGEDLWMAQHLLPGWEEILTDLEWQLTAELPAKTFHGSCSDGGSVTVTRPKETVKGKTVRTAAVTHGRAIAVGDLVLMLISPDGQTYYIAERMVDMNGIAIPPDPAPDVL